MSAAINHWASGGLRFVPSLREMPVDRRPRESGRGRWGGAPAARTDRSEASVLPLIAQPSALDTLVDQAHSSGSVNRHASSPADMLPAVTANASPRTTAGATLGQNGRNGDPGADR